MSDGLLLSDLTPAERLLIDRRRRREDQGEAGARHGVSRTLYSRWERGLRPPPAVELKNLRPNEKCLVYRRRAGLGQSNIARDLGVCNMTVRQMEQGIVNCDQLIWYWEQ